MGALCSSETEEPETELVQSAGHRTEAGKARAEARVAAAEKKKQKNYIVVPMEPMGDEEIYEKEARWFDAEKRSRELAQENDELRAKLAKQAPVLAQMKDLLDHVDELKDELKSISAQSNERQLYIEALRAELQSEPGLFERVDSSVKAKLRELWPVAESS